MVDPSKVAAVAARVVGNAHSHFLRGGVEPAHMSDAEVISEAPHAKLIRFHDSPGGSREPASADGVPELPGAAGEPILLIPPLAVSIACFDLRPRQSLAAFLALHTGRPVYIVDYGHVGFGDRRLGFEAWIDGILPMTIQQVSYLHGGAPVDVVTWSLGGTLTFLTAAAHPRLPLRSIAAVATPIDYSKVPHLVPLRQLGRYTGGHVVHLANRALGGQPAWVVRTAFRVTALQRELTRPWFLLRNLHDTEAIARMEAVDRFIDGMPGYPGRLWGQLYARAIQRNELASGQLTLGQRVIRLAEVRQDVLIVGGKNDAIAPIASVRKAIDVLTRARSVNYAEAPGSHLGVLTGPEAQDSTWLAIEEFLRRVAARSRLRPVTP